MLCITVDITHPNGQRKGLKFVSIKERGDAFIDIRAGLLDMGYDHASIFMALTQARVTKGTKDTMLVTSTVLGCVGS